MAVESPTKNTEQDSKEIGKMNKKNADKCDTK
jgi:hypothetical protein